MSLFTIFLILLVMVFAILVYFTEPSETDKRIAEKLAVIRQRLIQGEGEHEQDVVVHELRYSTVDSVDRFLRRTKLASRLQSYLEQAQVPWTVGRMVFFSMVLVAAGATLGNWRSPGIVGWLPGMLLGVLPASWVYYKRAARFRRFEALLPEAVDLMSRVLRAGHALPSALLTVAEEIPDPVGSEFRRTADELSFGLPFREGLVNLEKRFPLPELRFLVTAIVVQKESGGNLVELLDRSAALLRARVALSQKVRVYSAQGRLTGWILAALPLVLFLLLNYLRPEYAKPMLEDSLGRHLVYCGLGGMAVGMVLIRRIVNIKV